MMKNINRSAHAANEELQALAQQEKAMVNNIIAALKSAFSSEPSVGRSLSNLKLRGEAASHSVLAFVDRHPVAAALSVVGAGCLLYGLRRGAADDWSAYHQSRASYGVDPEYFDEWGEPLPATDKGEGAVKGRLDEIRKRADQFAPEARQFARNVGSRASHAAHEASESAHAAGKSIQSRSQEFTHTARETIRQHPVAAGVIGVALGVAVGGALYGNSRRKANANLMDRRLSDGNFARAGAFLSHTSNAARDAILGAKNRLTH